MSPSAPPRIAIAEAERVAAASPCAKSKHGVVAFRTFEVFGPIVSHGATIIAAGFNGPPGARGCDGSAECRASCSKRCVHAEMRAIRMIHPDDAEIGRIELVHVKIGKDGRVVPGGGPSCWQCSREVLDSDGIKAVWLFEHVDPLCPGPDCSMCNGEACNMCAASYAGDACDHDVIERHKGEPPEPPGVWHRYTAEEFHRQTCRNAEVYDGAR